ncbi:hypothetical protein [Alkaliphilus sp. B6464]|uniref:hypothetical protein n=1 Tax=Alkaliphilus sp. B6464 TaxID=2731219 RepID=UPI001BA9F3D7|nr:hypothetical protein [Alkaliphilus sp. B6464]QUH21892.1 hypothetical protein HYG84_18320 [Alkaliphilus sp. B6464]
MTFLSKIKRVFSKLDVDTLHETGNKKMNQDKKVSEESNRLNISNKSIYSSVKQLNKELIKVGEKDYQFKYSKRRKKVICMFTYKIDILHFQSNFYIDKKKAKQLFKTNFGFEYSTLKLNYFTAKIKNELKYHPIFELRSSPVFRNKENHYCYSCIYLTIKPYDIVQKNKRDMVYEMKFIKNRIDLEYKNICKEKN